MSLPNIVIKTPKTLDEFNAIIVVARSRGYDFKQGNKANEH